ncbi:cell division protein FtsL [Bartonella pachyuromydis]|uniref:Cell division protein FtsL n=1 Tax=Bartonella pachyuromydis TaxID=931097 RepID=A0ABP8VIR1_9HYPH
MTVFRTFDMILVMIMICMAGLTYKVKYDVQRRMSEIRHLEHEIAAAKNTVSLLHAEWAVMIEPSRMQKLAKRYQKELGLEVIQPRQVVEFKDIPVRVDDPIDEVIKQNILEERRDILANNRASQVNNIVQKGVR